MSERPFLRIVNGDASPEEIAALVTVLTARASAAAAAGTAPVRTAPVPRSAWADHSHRLRTPLPHGPGAWCRSALPR